MLEGGGGASQPYRALRSWFPNSSIFPSVWLKQRLFLKTHSTAISRPKCISHSISHPWLQPISAAATPAAAMAANSTSCTARADLTGMSHKHLKNLDRNLEKADCTPYGTLVKVLEAEQEPRPEAPAAAPPEYIKIKYACPFALLWLLCASSENFFNLLCTTGLKPQPSLGTGDQPVGRLVIYFDDVMPGNLHRPDKGRKYMALYWSLLDWPSWMLQSARAPGGVSWYTTDRDRSLA